MTTELSSITNNALREALEKILQPTTSTTEKIVRCSALQEDLQRKISSLTENLHKVSTECAERAGRVPQQLDSHVQWVKQARVRAMNVRKSLEATKTRLQGVLAHLEKMAANEEDHAKRTEAQMNSIVGALEKQGNTSFSSKKTVEDVKAEVEKEEEQKEQQEQAAAAAAAAAAVEEEKETKEEATQEEVAEEKAESTKKEEAVQEDAKQEEEVAHESNKNDDTAEEKDSSTEQQEEDGEAKEDDDVEGETEEEKPKEQDQQKKGGKGGKNKKRKN